MINEKDKLKAMADFAVTGFYQNIFKPYMQELMDQELKSLDYEPKSGFDSIKRDLNNAAVRRIFRIITTRIDTANSELSRRFLADSNSYIKKQ